MKKSTRSPYPIRSVAELHRLLSLPKPEHPLISVINMACMRDATPIPYPTFSYGFYSVCIKKDFDGQLKYGQQYYDFDHGVMTFFSPGQVLSVDPNPCMELSGYWIVFHTDFIQPYPLAKKIKEYGFFSYAVHEALHLSEKEEGVLTGIMQQIAQEYRSPIDTFSQDVIISYVEVLLNYCNRFYNRQFLTRKTAHHDLLAQLETLLDDYFAGDQVRRRGLPTVQYLSEQLHVSPNYLSDMLRSLTGQNTQQHIHNKLIEQAKDALTTTSLSVSEIAYQLGFEYPQSFSKLFKNKTQLSPLAFRQSFN
ncbi:Helix-turn-helix domain-containing protein [Catalinimonas alkaloidigena]|uniref:Helix-turn-helix domain-containing protein n=1 Tax=Catalinimonas alkaloidigena TaxID=1075417 RepID=A0A1G9S881_9BACT|nr:helix-turn-helix transcriptional regulator [Catalinimonas alkaloidigena]SDM31517.1 Helix-turn-helix domain-containing protein [Catalinimonas alkaloidigena]